MTMLMTIIIFNTSNTYWKLITLPGTVLRIPDINPPNSSFYNGGKQPGLVVQASILATSDAEAGGWQIQGLPGLYSSAQGQLGQLNDCFKTQSKKRAGDCAQC